VTTDGELIQRAATGDHSGSRISTHRYARPVFGLALRRLGDRGRAEDAGPGDVRFDLAIGRVVYARARAWRAWLYGGRA